MSTLRERFELRLKEHGIDPRNPPRPWYYNAMERWMKKGPRFYYVTLPLGSIAFGVLWYLPFEMERKAVNNKNLWDLWKPLITKALSAQENQQ